MLDVSLADAKSRLSELVERAAKGESVRITRRGKPVAVINGLGPQPKFIDVSELKALTDSMPLQSEPSGTWLRKIRDDSRY